MATRENKEILYKCIFSNVKKLENINLIEKWKLKMESDNCNQCTIEENEFDIIDTFSSLEI